MRPVDDRSLPSGAIAMLVTAFNADGSVDVDSMASQACFALHQGATGIAIFGLAGEGAKLTTQEKVDITAVVASVTAASVPLIAAADALGTREACHLGMLLGNAGASLLMAMPPSSVSTTDDIARHYEELTAAADLRCIVQDAPAASHVPLSIETLRHLVHSVAGVSAIKVEAPPIAAKVGQLRQSLPPECVLYGGRGGVTLLAEAALGADGTMVGPAYLDVFARAFEHDDAGEREAARRAAVVLASLTEGNDPYAQMQKLLLHSAGVIASPTMRAPSTEVSQVLRDLWLRTVSDSPTSLRRLLTSAVT